ncbi:MAG: hypothetical protein HYT12_04620 [Candidatus Liptonbacteria bacterium]|nr:hypothetical protein [Candidatus Liptonbacteria bacterium]
MKSSLYFFKYNFVAYAALSMIFLASIFLFTEQNSSGQVDIEACQNEYQVRQFKCIDNLKACSDACDKSSAGNFDAFASCQEPCNSRRNDCDAAANALYAECLGVGSQGLGLPEVEVTPAPTENSAGQQQPITQPPAVTAPKTVVPVPAPIPAPAETPARSISDQQGAKTAPERYESDFLPKRVTVNGITYVPALVETKPTKNMFKDPVFVESSNMAKSELCVGASCTIPVKFQGEPKMIKSELCVGASCTIPVKFQMKTADLVVTKPKLTFNTKDAGSSFTIDVGKWLVDAKTEKGTLELSDTEASEILQEKLAEILNREQATAVNSVTVEIGSPPIMPRERLSQSEYNFQQYQLQVPLILFQSNRIGPNPYEVPEGFFRGSSLAVYPDSKVNLSVAENPHVDIGGPADSPKIVAEVNTGSAIYVSGGPAEDILSSMPDFLGAVSGYGVSHKKTAYGIAHDPENGKSVIEIYDGEIEIFDRQTGKVLASLSTVFGADIKRIEIDAGGIMTEKIAIPQSEWVAFVAKTEKGTLSTAWRWGAAILIIGSIGYFVYRKKDAFMKLFKKQPMQ